MTDFHGYDILSPLVGDIFTFTFEGEPVALTLAEAESRGMSPAGVPAGTLTFTGPREPVLPQATYDVSHADLGDFELFVVPVAQGDAGTVYEAIFA